MLLEREKSAVILVDVQSKLTPLTIEPEQLVENCRWMLEAAEFLNIPTVVSEHYPKGLGGTVPELEQFKTPDNQIEKVHFSCANDSKGLQTIQALNRPQIVLIGIEAHVCILQTALRLQEEGLSCFVVVDAISSRVAADKNMGVQRMRAHGVEIITREMALFEWLRCAGTDEFRQASKQFLR